MINNRFNDVYHQTLGLVKLLFYKLKDMITGFITFYNIFRINKSKIYWLNLDNGEGLNTALIGLIVDGILLCLYSSLT